ncbi:putative short-chain dehydrogenase [Pusillimonas sp. T7-7]|nr:putative short-chain dehydrogenase [Pusillimonas sp. T7-7]
MALDKDKAKAERENRSYDSVVQESVGSIPVKRYGETRPNMAPQPPSWPALRRHTLPALLSGWMAG